MEEKNLSAVIITYNEEQFLALALESVAFADEIVVVDSFSADRTVEIARQFTEKVYQRKFDDFSSQRNYSLGLAEGRWVLVIDADEIVTAGLKNEILAITNSSAENSAYAIPRDNVFMGKAMRRAGLGNDHVVRLFPRTVKYRNRVHEVPDTGELQVKNLKEKLKHITYKGYEEMVRKTYRYSALRAIDMYEKGYRPTLFKMMFKPAFRFIKHYIFQGGFMEGKRGFIFSYMTSMDVFMRISQTWRLRAGERIQGH